MPSPPRKNRPALAIAGVAVIICLFAVAIFIMLPGSAERTGLDRVAAIGGPFSLTNGDGKTVTDADLRGKYALVYFGYTFCPDVCPTTLNEVATALQSLGPKAKALQAVFISVDPARDTPAVMKRYTEAFDPRIMGLTGSPEQVAKVAKEFRVYYATHRTGPGPTDYTVDHSSILYLMGPDGRFVAPIRADEKGEAMAADVAEHMG
jgi:protein SCO1